MGPKKAAQVIGQKSLTSFFMRAPPAKPASTPAVKSGTAQTRVLESGSTDRAEDTPAAAVVEDTVPPAKIAVEEAPSSSKPVKRRLDEFAANESEDEMVKKAKPAPAKSTDKGGDKSKSRKAKSKPAVKKMVIEDDEEEEWGEAEDASSVDEESGDEYSESEEGSDDDEDESLVDSDEDEIEESEEES